MTGRERGSVSLVAAAMLAMTLVMAIAAADVVRVLASAAEAQTAADAAALAAAQELALPSEADPADVAREFADRNGATLLECRCDRETFEAQVRVRVAVGTLLLFADDRVVDAEALALVELPS